MLDVPLLFETATLLPLCDVIIVVSVSPKTQLARLMRRDSLSKPDAKARVDAQMPLQAKVERASYVVENDGTREALEKRVAEVMSDIRRRYPSL